MKQTIRLTLCAAAALAMASCTVQPSAPAPDRPRVVIYQMFTRLFGDTCTAPRPWGTAAQNGVGKFADITSVVLDSLHSFGITHVWFTGVPHHASTTDYSAHGIAPDDPDVVKGRAGSPYAVRDYYNVDPDLAVNPDRRLDEFVALVERAHRSGLKVIIDIVPNHVARRYHSPSHPEADFGLNDDTTVVYARDNNFYYVVGQAYQSPTALDLSRTPDGDGFFAESPAKWTGNGARTATPDINDWYETVKVNYGIRPDGTRDFDSIPPCLADTTAEALYAFWQGRDVPDSWTKFRDIALFWLSKGVDGFRYDMAEMVPVEFWSYMNSAIKHARPDALLMAEIYNPAAYGAYISVGKMDYLYDKVQLYDTLRAVTMGTSEVGAIAATLSAEAAHADHLLHFMENHDEHRIASADFAGSARRGFPAMVVSALTNSAPLMLYFGQELGEPAEADAGFGRASRTTIFDYYPVPAIREWYNRGLCNAARLTDEQRAVRHFYRRLLAAAKCNVGRRSLTALQVQPDTARVAAFASTGATGTTLIVSNFSADAEYAVTVSLPDSIAPAVSLPLRDALGGFGAPVVRTDGHGARIELTLKPLQSAVWQGGCPTSN